MLECACACPSYYHKGLYELTFGLVPYAETKRCSFVATERCFQTQSVCHWVFEDESLELALRIFNVSAMCDPGIVSECEAKGHATSYEGQAAPVACDETNETVDNNAMGLCLSVNFYFLADADLQVIKEQEGTYRKHRCVMMCVIFSDIKSSFLRVLTLDQVEGLWCRRVPRFTSPVQLSLKKFVSCIESWGQGQPQLWTIVFLPLESGAAFQ